MPLPMPMPPQSPGAPPPGMPAPGGTGPAVSPGPMPGAAAHGESGVKTALELLQKALPTLPMGSKKHTAVLKAVTDLTKAMTEDGGGMGGDPSGMIQHLIAAQKEKMSG